MRIKELKQLVYLHKEKTTKIVSLGANEPYSFRIGFIVFWRQL